MMAKKKKIEEKNVLTEVKDKVKQEINDHHSIRKGARTALIGAFVAGLIVVITTLLNDPSFIAEYGMYGVAIITGLLTALQNWEKHN